MDIQKDNQKDKGISPIHYNPELFHNDHDFYLAYRKIEHIVAAVFLITGLIDKNTLLKQSIQEHSLQCLAEFVSLIGRHNVGVSDIQTVSSRVLHLNALLDIGFWAGEVSQMNLAILQKEVSATYEMLNDLSTKYRSSFYISSSFFKSNHDLLQDLKEKDKRHDLPQKHIPASKPEPYKGQEYKRHDIKDSNKGHNQAGAADAHKGQRREAILTLLRQKGNLTVKDFTSVVTEYSEKTIQRELLSLVEEGIVRKEGERRWSTYSLAL